MASLRRFALRDTGPKLRWCGRPWLCAVRPDLALDLPSKRTRRSRDEHHEQAALC